MFLDFYNGQVDADSQPVDLTSTPTRLTIVPTVPTGSIGEPVVEVRTAATGAVDLEASALSLQQESVVETTGSTATEAKGGQSRTQVASATGLGSGAWVTFGTTRQASVTMKVAISYVSQRDAWQNLTVEDPGWSTAAVAARTRAEWNGYLDRIRIGGGTPAEQAEFYPALYHALLDPTVFSDVNGEYIGFGDHVHQLPRARSSTPTTPAGTSTAARRPCWPWWRRSRRGR